MNFDELLSGESQTVEYKKERSASSKSYVKTVVAFANACGGNLVFGVDDKTHEVLGIPDERVLEDMDAIANAIMDSVEPQVLPEITVKSASGKNLILVEVPVGRQCPYYLKSEGVEGGVYVRVGATTRHADLEWARMLSQECAQGGYDRLVRRGRTVTDEQIDALCERMYEVAVSRASEERRGLIRRVARAQLLSWGLLRERDGEMLPTNAFLALTGDPEVVRPLQCAVFKDDSRAVFLDRRDIEGDLMAQIDGAYLYALEKMNMGADLGGVVRRDVYEIPGWSVREVITNAVLHRSYIEGSPTQVALYSDRLEVSSPGGIVRGFSLDRALSGESCPRNGALAQAFLYMGLIESWGSGIPRVRRELAEAGLREPEFVDVDGRMRVNLWRPTAEEFAARLRGETAPAASDGADGGPSDAAVQAAKTDRKPIETDRTDGKPIETDRKPIETDRGALVVSYLKEHEDAGISELAEVLGLGKDRAKAVVRDMVSRGLVAKVGDKRYARYVLPEGEN